MTQPSSRSSHSLASQADPLHLYGRAVQNPQADIDFITRVWGERRRRAARALREDFCGTALVCREWVLRHPHHEALGVDCDATVLAWARRHSLAGLSAHQRQRLELRQGDARAVRSDPMDLVLAMNFSYWLLMSRAELLAYFRAVHETLAEDGLFFLDAYGGYDAPRELVETRRIEDGCGEPFTYVWEQADFDPISARMRCHIHFRFDDGSALERAFSYEWRLWTLPEIRELLAEAGFGRIDVYWQGWDAEGEPDGDFQPVARGTADAAWIAYLSAEKARTESGQV